MNYYRLTDTVNRGTIIRAEGPRQEVFNTGTGQWEPTCLLLQYMMPGDVFEGLYEKISEQDVDSLIQTTKAEWVGYWNAVKTLIGQSYTTLSSPVKNMSYADYIPCIIDFAHNERERVLLGLSGLPLLPNWKAIARKLKLSKLLIEALSMWHTATYELFQTSNDWVLSAVRIELDYLMSRRDLADVNAVVGRYNRIKAGYTSAQAYQNVRI